MQHGHLAVAHHGEALGAMLLDSSAVPPHKGVEVSLQDRPSAGAPSLLLSWVNMSCIMAVVSGDFALLGTDLQDLLLVEGLAIITRRQWVAPPCRPSAWQPEPQWTAGAPDGRREVREDASWTEGAGGAWLLGGDILCRIAELLLIHCCG